MLIEPPFRRPKRANGAVSREVPVAVFTKEHFAQKGKV
jgi:hypothetical protein